MSPPVIERMYLFEDANQSKNVGDNLLIMRARERNVFELQIKEVGEEEWG